MKIHRINARTIALEEIDGILAQMLRDIPASADPSGSAAAEKRLFPSPTGGREPEADEDWRELIEPDLRALFLDAVEIVRDDLKKLPAKGAGDDHSLRLPVKHLEAWIHALNQARLTLAARHGFSDLELERGDPLEGGEKSFVLFKIHFYGLLQEYFLRQLDEP